jgi:hypothetical protein
MHPTQHDVVGGIAEHLDVKSVDPAHSSKAFHTEKCCPEPTEKRHSRRTQEYQTIEGQSLREDGAILPEHEDIERLILYFASGSGRN